LSKSFHLNGEAISALVFSYILGQQSFIKKMTPEQEQEIVDKLGKLKTYEDTLDKNPIPAVSPSSVANTPT